MPRYRNSRYTVSLPSDRPGAKIRPDHLIEDGVEAARGAVERRLEELEEYARANPRETILAAVAGGYVLRTLPLVKITGGLIRLAVLLIKPAAAFYLASRLWNVAMGASRVGGNPGVGNSAD
jgi:hypothetical protein